MLKRVAVLGCVLAAAAAAAVEQEPWDAADANGEAARVAFLKCWRFVQGWLQAADPSTGLIPRNLDDSPYWNARDAAADNYPFMVLTAFFTDRALFEGRMKDMLAAEQRLCNRVDRLPDDYVFEAGAFRTPEPRLEDLIFGASEYAKDGLLPVTEWMGPSPWSDRMLGLLDDLWAHGTVETEVGRIPAASHEVAGNLMQSLSRMYWMTGNTAYRDRVFQLGDYFLLHHLPTESQHLQLDDHGCEVVNGLSEAYYLAAKTAPERHERWRPRMQALLDRILEVGRDEHGLLFSVIDPRAGKKLTDDRTDNWGYNYNAFLVVAELDGAQRFHDAVAFMLGNLLEVKDYPWEGGGADGYADSLEGGLNLLNRVPAPEAIAWADCVAAILLAKPRDTGIIEGWHGDGNFARTALMYALWKTQGAWLEPWRADLRLGAARGENGAVLFSIGADWPWKGRLRFDIPRHAEHLHMPSDYPRLNQFPEWFTVGAEGTYATSQGDMTAAELRAGLEVTVKRDSPFRLCLGRR